MKTIVVAALLLATMASAAPPIWAELHKGYTFEQYKKDFGKKYSAEEEPRRRALFELRLQEVLMHNSRPSSYKKGVNPMTDWTDEERRGMLGTFARHGASVSSKAFTQRKAPLGDLPKSVDWRQHDPQVISAVKNQGHCGSCWAHATAEQLESNWAIESGKLFVLSTQQLTSCVKNPHHCGGNGGCTGATVELGFAYAKEQGGLTEEWQYSYDSFFGDVPSCQWKNGSKAQPAIPPPKDFVVLPRNDPKVVMETLANVGPLAISVDASHWHDYESGIFDGCPYSKNITMNHAVQLVGYGTDEKLNKDYWIVRNSWSAKYGENGYIRLYKEKGKPECGWDNDWVTGGGGCDGEDNDVWACGQCGTLYDSVYVTFGQ